MTEPIHTPEKVRRYICPGCSAHLVYEPVDSALTCPYCGRREKIPETAEQIQERSYEEYLRPSEDRLSTLASNALEVNCSSCGATVAFTPPEVAGECPFCGTPLVAQPRVADPLVAPEGVLPFQISQKLAGDAIQKWLSTRWFAPNALRKMTYREGVTGIYLPHWTFDSHTLSYYQGERGEFYYVTETYVDTDAQGNQVRRTRQVRHTRWFAASGQVQRWFDDVLVPATKSVNKQQLESVSNWELALLRPYDPAYLAGFKAQRYEVGLAEGFDVAKGFMTSVIDGDVRRDIGGDEQRVHEVRTQYSGISFKHILLPIYLGAYRFNQRAYQVMVNANTGVVTGDRPYSIWKILFFVLFLIAVLTGIIILMSANK